MVEVYYYLPAAEADVVVECGLKLSRWADREIKMGGEVRKCISALLNPRDDMDKYRSSAFKCLKLEIQPDYCYIADRYLYEAGKIANAAMDMYYGSVIPVENYMFGTYRLPECLVFTTIMSEQISFLSRGMDSPILYDNSEDLYINNVIETYREYHSNFNDCLLYNFYCKLAEIGKADKIEDREKKIAVFFDRKREKVFSVRIPDMSEY